MWEIDYEKMYRNAIPQWYDAYMHQPIYVGNLLVFVRELNDLWFSEYIDIDCYDYKNFGWWQKYRRGEVKYWMPLPEFPSTAQTAEQIANDELHNAIRIAQIREAMNNSSIQNWLSSPFVDN